MYHKLNKSIFLLFLLIFSCKFSETEALENNINLDEELKVKSEKYEINELVTPGVVPSDHELLSKLYDFDNLSWKYFYEFYINKLDSEKGKHYYENLEWMNLSYIITSKDFKTAPIEIKLELWERLEQRRVFNNPEVAYKLIKYLQVETNNNKETAKRAHTVKVTNENHYKCNPDLWAELIIKYNDIYHKLDVLTYDRWGMKLYPEPEKK